MSCCVSVTLYIVVLCVVLQLFFNDCEPTARCVVHLNAIHNGMSTLTRHATQRTILLILARTAFASGARQHSNDQPQTKQH
jgi:hypothetical protein